LTVARKIFSEDEPPANRGLRKRRGRQVAAASEMLTPASVVARRRSIEIPRTMAIRLTNAALNGPVRRATVPGTKSATVIVIAVLATVPIRSCRNRCTDRDSAHKA
jgi:hypothetical protein